ncbi:hypothetical protein ABGB18_37150 [Nonomuraea sp. B12E4]
MTEFLASLLAKAALILLEALITRFVQSLAAYILRPAGLRLA